MRILLRLVALIAYVVGGYLIGFTIGRLLLIPVAAVAHMDKTFESLLPIAAGVVGAVSGLGWFNARFALPAARGGVHGSAHFASAAQIKSSLGGAAGLIVGRENRKGGQLLRYAGQAHLLTIAPTRSGKGVGAIIPNLLTADRSVLCIDPKGENARITARARSGQPSAAFNPLAGLDPDSHDLAEDAALIADALVHDPPGQGGEAHWNEEAKALIAGVILYVVCNEGPEVRTLSTVRELLTASPQEFRVMLEIMQKTTSAGGLVRRAANRHLGKSEREAASVLSSAQRHTHFLDSVRINQTMASSDFRFADLKETKATVFLVLPPERLDAYSRWLRHRGERLNGPDACIGVYTDAALPRTVSFGVATHRSGRRWAADRSGPPRTPPLPDFSLQGPESSPCGPICRRRRTGFVTTLPHAFLEKPYVGRTGLQLWEVLADLSLGIACRPTKADSF